MHPTPSPDLLSPITFTFTFFLNKTPTVSASYPTLTPFISQDALHEDLNRCTRYTAGHLESSGEIPSNTVAASASMAWKKLTGQNGKRVITLHVASNESASDRDRRDELGRDKGKESKKELESIAAVSPVVNLPSPLSLDETNAKKEENTPTCTLTLQVTSHFYLKSHTSNIHTM